MLYNYVMGAADVIADLLTGARQQVPLQRLPALGAVGTTLVVGIERAAGSVGDVVGLGVGDAGPRTQAPRGTAPRGRCGR